MESASPTLSPSRVNFLLRDTSNPANRITPVETESESSKSSQNVHLYLLAAAGVAAVIAAGLDLSQDDESYIKQLILGKTFNPLTDDYGTQIEKERIGQEFSVGKDGYEFSEQSSLKNTFSEEIGTRPTNEYRAEKYDEYYRRQFHRFNTPERLEALTHIHKYPPETRSVILEEALDQYARLNTSAVQMAAVELIQTVPMEDRAHLVELALDSPQNGTAVAAALEIPNCPPETQDVLFDRALIDPRSGVQIAGAEIIQDSEILQTREFVARVFESPNPEVRLRGAWAIETLPTREERAPFTLLALGDQYVPIQQIGLQNLSDVESRRIPSILEAFIKNSSDHLGKDIVQGISLVQDPTERLRLYALVLESESRSMSMKKLVISIVASSEDETMLTSFTNTVLGTDDKRLIASFLYALQGENTLENFERALEQVRRHGTISAQIVAEQVSKMIAKGK